MNILAIIHRELEEKGVPVLSISEDGTILFDDKATEEQKKETFLFLENFKPPTRVEIEEKVRANQESLLTQLLIERFYPDYIEESDGKRTGVRPV